MDQTISILWIFLLPLTAWSLWKWYQHPGQSRFTRRPVDITRLPHIFASLSPAIAPVMPEGDPGKLLHGGKRPEQRVALTPEAFVEQHSLITSMQLDVAATEQCFMAQLGQVS